MYQKTVNAQINENISLSDLKSYLSDIILIGDLYSSDYMLFRCFVI